MSTKNFFLGLVAALSLNLFLIHAQEKQRESPPPPKTGFRAEFLTQLNDVEKKLTDLANAVPPERYSWRPMEGVRSVSEVFMHIAGANYLLPQSIGIKAPAGLDRDMEKTTTDKTKVLETLRESFAFMRQAALSTPDTDLDKPAKLFGEETTIRGVFFNAAVHMHEHLGQSIAYTRMNHIVHPWTAREQERNKENSKK